MHFRCHGASFRTRGRVFRPQTGSGKFLGKIFDDRQRFPNAHVAVAQHRHFARPAPAVTHALKSFASNEITVSSNAIPAAFMPIHGRNDHDE
jgi:hypothetical protein